MKRALGLVALLLAVYGCGKSNFKDECAQKNVKKSLTVRGVFLKSHNDLWLECDDPKRKYLNGGAGAGASRGCMLELWAKEKGASAPNIDVYMPVGDKPGKIKPLPASFQLKDIHIVTDDGKTAELGDVVEITGELDTTYGECEMAKVESVKVVDDNY